MDKISIIVPVYNVSKYLKKCIDGLISQTYSNIEIFLVDDGSTDDSGQICDEYAKIDNRIIVIHKENGGQGTARNLALKQCKGDYICFVDSDDWVDNDYVEYLYNNLKKYDLDISICNYRIYDESGKFIRKRNIGEGHREFTAIEAIQSMWYGEIVNIGPWVKLYKRELWKDIYFEECFSEDFATMHKVYIRAKKIGYFYDCKLNYLIRESSDIHSFNPKKLIMTSIGENNIEFAKNYPQLIDAAKSKAMSVNFHILFQLPKNKEYKEISAELKKKIIKGRFEVLKNKRTSKKTKAALILSFGGFKLTHFVFTKIKKHNASL